MSSCRRRRIQPPQRIQHLHSIIQQPRNNNIDRHIYDRHSSHACSGGLQELWTATGFCARPVWGPCPWGGRARCPSMPAPYPLLSLGATRLLLVAAVCSYSPNYSFLGVLLLVGYPCPLCAPTRSLPAPARCSCPSVSVLTRCPCSYSSAYPLHFSLGFCSWFPTSRERGRLLPISRARPMIETDPKHH